METIKCSSRFILILAIAWLTPLSDSRSSGGSGKIGAGAAIGGIGTYAAYRSWNKENNPNPGTESEESLRYTENFIVLESSYSRRREGIGMSAWTLLMLILGIIGGMTICWYCYAIGLPLWRDRQASRRRSYTLTSVNVKGGDEVPLHETPSTATPSP